MRARPLQAEKIKKETMLLSKGVRRQFVKASVRGIGMFCEVTASRHHGASGGVWVSILRWFEREAEDAAPEELETMFGLGSTRMPSLTGLEGGNR